MTSEVRSRVKGRIGITVFLAFLFLLLFPAFICGCHFHAIAIIPNLPPILWGFYALFTYGNGIERIVGWSAFGVGLASLWLGFDANHKFALRDYGRLSCAEKIGEQAVPGQPEER